MHSGKSAGSRDETRSDASKSSNGQPGLPAISLPKGGGAIRGIGEKFAANPVTGTGSLSVPISTSPGRSGFGPSLSLSYDSGAGNGPFGFGWSLSLPSISRKTSKGIPKYQDGDDDDDESDVFILSGAEDLVPVFEKDKNGKFKKDKNGNFVIDEHDRDGYTVRRYRPRTEGLFARIERWTHKTNGDVHWRSISKDNILTVYGKSPESRIADPSDESGHKIFSWLICQSYDDKGNAILYEYAEEDEKGIEDDILNINERNRVRTANRYIKRIFYGNDKPLLIDPTKSSFRKSHLEVSDSDLASIDCRFQVVFDYDEDHYKEIPLNPNKDPGDQYQLVEASASAGGIWSGRPDPFSSFRSSFEIRTYRRCHRVLMFHQFPELGDEPYLVRSTEFNYSDFDYSDTSFSISDELNHKGSTRIASFIQSVTQSGYVKDETKQPVHSINDVKFLTYIKKSIPPLEFEYSKCRIQHEIKDLDETVLENLPIGIDGRGYQLVDIDGDGIPGILTEQADTWFYKPSLGNGHFGPIEVVRAKPSTADINSGRQQLMDLAGDGQLDLVQISGPVPGFFERNHNNSWENFAPFDFSPNVSMDDPNLRLVDLTGNGRADILITENEVFTWYQSLAEKGFKSSTRVIQELDEEKGPSLVLSESSQSIYLADMSGDGSPDLVRIKNGEVCYWPNLGYGRFGSKVTMDNSPWFDTPDQFDNKNIRLADIDNSGVTDIIYVGGNENKGIKIYFNQSGNRWSDAYYLDSGLQIDDHSSIQVADLLGNGTACLLWSSPLPGNSLKPMRYLDLMGGIKPHLLVKCINNLGAETLVEYVSSTKFYLADKTAGKPWITRLPFPVHVVERVITYDYISRNLFVTKSAYHHGYFDGIEREFRGFGMVEQWDTEEFAALSNSDNLPIPDAENIDAATHIPPVYTKTWFHTGIYLGREHISDFFGGLIDTNDRGEYYREPEWRDDDRKARKRLLDDTILPEELTVEEEFEACRALRGSMLRQEVYSIDGTYKAEHPYTVTEQNFTIRLVQPRGKNKNAVFFTHARESVNYHYERKLFPVLNGKVIDESAGPIDTTNPEIKWIADPRVQHAVTLEVDSFGNVLKSVAIGYGRRLDAPDSALLPEDREKQRLVHITCTENMFTNPVVESDDAYRTPLPAETSSYEMRKPNQEKSRRNEMTKLYKFDTLMNNVDQAADRKYDIVYEDIDFNKAKENPNEANKYFRRLIEQVRTLYRPNDLGADEDDPLTLLQLGTVESLALPGETYKLAFTRGLLAQVFKRGGRSLLPNPADVLSNGSHGGDKGGYLQSQQFKTKGIFPNTDPDDHWWVRSGRAFTSPNSDDSAAKELEYASKHFFLQLRYRDPFHTKEASTESFLTLDIYDLLVLETRDAVDNLVTVGQRLPDGKIDPANDYRVLQPRLITDPNGSRTEVLFDTLGMVAGTAVKGKDESEGDNLDEFKPDLTQNETDEFYEVSDPHVPAAKLLKGATTRIIYDLHRFYRSLQEHPEDSTQWLPEYAATMARETHVSDEASTNHTKIQISFSYSDGFGREIQKKIQAEPGPVVEGGDVVDPRWVDSGWIIFNNKGKPVRQYEPFFSQLPERGHRFEFGVQVGVSPILFYDPMERVVVTLHSNHTYEKVVFDPWQQTTWDVNDTTKPPENPGDPPFDPKDDEDVGHYFKPLADDDYLPTWYDLRTDPAKALKAWPDTDLEGDPIPDNAKRRTAEKSAAEKAAAHYDTPTSIYLDTLGRPFLTFAHNKVVCEGHDLDGTEDKFNTRIDLDIEGNQRKVRDTIVQNGDMQGRIVMSYDYDMLGNRIKQLSMDAGAGWMLNDVAGKPIRAWDSRDHIFRTEYDPLRRLLRSFVTGADPADLNKELLTDRLVYGETLPNPEVHNLRGKVVEQFDQTGKVTTDEYDFKGNPLRSQRKLAKSVESTPAYKTTVDWSASVQLETDTTYTSRTRYDALNRPIQLIAPHIDQPNVKRNVIQPVYNEASLLEQVHVWLEHPTEPEGLLNPGIVPPSPVGVNNIDYDAKGQRKRIDYKNGTITLYDYDEQTFRLIHLLTLRNADTFSDDCPHDPPEDWPGCQVQNLHYTYDPVGNITKIRDDAQQKIFFKNMRVEPNAEYTYDAIYRLIEATGREHLGQSSGSAPTPHSYNDASHVGRPHPNERDAMGRYKELYVYDGAGNISEMHHYRAADRSRPAWTRSYVYDETSLIEDGKATSNTLRKTSNRLSSTTIEGNNPLVETYAYDFHGNMTKMPQLQIMQYDFRDQLCMTQRQKVNDEDDDGEEKHGERTYYTYDSTRQRVRKITELPSGKLKDERIYLGQFEIYRRHSGANARLVRETLHIMDDKQRIALVETRNDVDDDTPKQLIRYQFSNHLGSTSLELSDEEEIISYEEYTPYGSTSYQAVRSDIEVNPKRYRYTAMERDEETGLNYHMARYYAPWLGRWASADPVGISAGLNVYGYVNNNPLVKHDTAGTDEIDIHHRTTAEAGTNMVEKGVNVRQYGHPNRRWAGWGFYAGSSENIPDSAIRGKGRNPADYNTIVRQRISSEGMVTLDPSNTKHAQFIAAQSDDEVGRAARDQYKKDWRVQEKNGPILMDADRNLRDKMTHELAGISGDAPVVRWKNPDGTYTYIVRHQSAILDKPTIAGTIVRGKFRPNDGSSNTYKSKADAKTAEPKATAKPTEPKRTFAGEGKGGKIGALDVANDLGKDVGPKVGNRAVKTVDNLPNKAPLKLLPIIGIEAGLYSIEENIRAGNYGSALLDAIGLIPIFGDYVDYARFKNEINSGQGDEEIRHHEETGKGRKIRGVSVINVII